VLPSNILHACPVFYLYVHKCLMDNGCYKNDALLRWIFFKLKERSFSDVLSLRDTAAENDNCTSNFARCFFFF
jgi:hypothetical protein